MPKLTVDGAVLDCFAPLAKTRFLSSSFVPLWLRVKQTVFQRGIGLGFISHKATNAQRRQEEAYLQSSAPPRLRASKKEGYGSRGGAEARREGGLDFRSRASEGEVGE